jgi:hypothetical protein
MTVEPPNTKSDPTLGYEERFSTIKPTDIEKRSVSRNLRLLLVPSMNLNFLYLDFTATEKLIFL